MNGRVVTSVATAVPLLATVSLMCVGSVAGLSAGSGTGHRLVAAEGPVPCSTPSTGTGEVCRDQGSGTSDSQRDGSSGRSRTSENTASRTAEPSPAPTETPSPQAPTPPGDGHSGDADQGGAKELRYEHGVDSKSWYWEQQRDEEVAFGPLSQRARLPSPQRPDTLPVAVESGESSKQSAIRFDLVAHGIVAGSEVSRFVLTVAEGDDPREVPTVNPENHEVRACAASTLWPPGEAETWDTRPDVADQCVRGTRHGGRDQATWTFDLSAMAATWGEDPFANNGVLLTGVAPGSTASGETWQVNLKAPQRDDPVTPVDEYAQTADRMTAEVAYTPAPPGAGPGGSAISNPSGASSGLSGGSGGGGLGGGGLGGGASVKAAGTSQPATDVQAQPTNAATPPFAPRVPWYVWALVPAAMLSTVLVRQALAESAVVTRPGGVIETIRSRNATVAGPGSTKAGDGLLARLVDLLPFERAGR